MTNADPGLPLDDHETTAWRSLVLFWRLGVPQLDRTFRRHGLTHLEYGLLAVLSEEDGGVVSAGELAALAGVTSSRLSHRVRTMEDRGDIARAPDPNDGRGVLVRVTDAGRARIAAVADEHRSDVRRLVFDHLDADQTRALADAMAAIASRLTDHPFLWAGRLPPQ